MASSSLIISKDASNRSACGSGLFLLCIENLGIALLAGLLPLLYCLALLATATLALWHAHLTIVALNFGQGVTVHDGIRVLVIIVESAATVLLLRQLFTPAGPKTLRMELLPGDQPELFEVIKVVADKVRAPVPAKVVVDSTAGLSADYLTSMGAIWGKGLVLNIGLCLPVGVTATEFVGLLAHELAFFTRGSGELSARFVRGVHRWFMLRIKHDPWLDWLEEGASGGRWIKRWSFRFLWLWVWLSLRPLRLLYGLCRLLTGGTFASHVRRADACAARLIGSRQMAAALERQGAMTSLVGQILGGLKGKSVSVRLPDSLPLLVSRRLMIEEVPEEAKPKSSHWLDLAPADQKRSALILRQKSEGMVEAAGDATALFRNFHDLARRVTYFHYQNAWELAINEHRLVAVEETVHESRASMQTIEVLNRYFNGLAHPERAFCGIAEEHGSLRDVEVLRMELHDCRDWLARYGERMAAALKEWSKAWRLVRDLQTAYALSRAGISVSRYQFDIASTSPEAFLEEIERQRHIMDNMEGVLRQYEGRLETRIATSLELLWRADFKSLPAELASFRETLPHWVLIYEALGLNLPVLRELMTQFHAFLSLGATVSGMVVSATYMTAVQALMPPIVTLATDILSTVGQWPYPFKMEGNSRIVSLAEFLAPEASHVNLQDLVVPKLGAGLDGERLTVAQVNGRKLCEVVGPLIDRYLSLYHQSFAWVTKVSDMAEWRLFNPFDEERTRQAAVKAEMELPGFLPPLSHSHAVDPELEHALPRRVLAA